MRKKSERRNTVTDAELSAVIIDLANRLHGGQYAPNLSRFTMHAPRGWPVPQQLLKQRGFRPQGGIYTEAWQRLVKQLTGLTVHQTLPSKPRKKKEAVVFPSWIEQYREAWQITLEWGIAVSSWREDKNYIYLMLR